MPRFDQKCTACSWTADIVVRAFERPPCPDCGAATERYYPIGGRANGVIGDEILGGRWVENIAATPVYVESKSQYRRELAARGLVEKVRHVGLQGSDKNPRTQRWV